MPDLHTFEPYLSIAASTSELRPVVSRQLPDPVVVGAVGGSGTRLVTQLLEGAGIHMGPSLNDAGDFLLWPPMQRLLSSGAIRHSSSAAISSHAFRAMEDLIILHRQLQDLSGPHGLKVPASFIWLPELAAYFPAMRYVHVVRHGLDMAYSRNKQQFLSQAWYFGINGRELNETDLYEVTPQRQLDYWLKANAYALDQAEQWLEGRFHIVDFDRLCDEPDDEILRLLSFLQLDSGSASISGLTSLVRPPASIGRHKTMPWTSTFSSGQLAAVDALEGRFKAFNIED